MSSGSQDYETLIDSIAWTLYLSGRSRAPMHQQLITSAWNQDYSFLSKHKEHLRRTARAVLAVTAPALGVSLDAGTWPIVTQRSTLSRSVTTTLHEAGPK